MAVKCGNCKEHHASVFDVEDCYFGPENIRTCPLCDAVGHGYPGAGPCPLEERGWEEARAEEARNPYL